MTVGSDVIVDAGTVAAMLTADPPPTGAQADLLVDVLSAAPDDALEFVTGQVECRAARGADTEPLSRCCGPEPAAGMPGPSPRSSPPAPPRVPDTPTPPVTS